MGIAIEGMTLVVRLDRISKIFPEGVSALEVEANASAGQDEHLWRCCFMADEEGEVLYQKLLAKGLNAGTGADPDMVLVNEFDLEVHPYCDWLKVHRMGKAVIAWLDGHTPETVVATLGWSFENGSRLQRKAVDDPDLEFRRVDSTGIEVYFNKKLNEEVFVARKTPSAAALKWKFTTAANLIQRFWSEPGRPPLGMGNADQIRAAITELEIVATHAPEEWRAHYFSGKGWQAIGELQNAYESLKRAYDISHEYEGVPRELAGLCLELGRADEAMKVGECAAGLMPDNHETLGNLACAYLIGRKHSEAIKTIDSALKLQPDDHVNRNLKSLIEAVIAGRRPQPNTLAELMRVEAPQPPVSKSSWNPLNFMKRK